MARDTAWNTADIITAILKDCGFADACDWEHATQWYPHLQFKLRTPADGALSNAISSQIVYEQLNEIFIRHGIEISSFKGSSGDEPTEFWIDTTQPDFMTKLSEWQTAHLEAVVAASREKIAQQKKFSENKLQHAIGEMIARNPDGSLLDPEQAASQIAELQQMLDRMAHESNIKHQVDTFRAPRTGRSRAFGEDPASGD